MANTGQIVKSRTNKEFTHVPNKVAQDTTLSFLAKGLLLYLLSLPDDWVTWKTKLPKQTGEKKGTVDRAFKELQDRGYINSIRMFEKSNGKFIGWNHVIYSESFKNPDIENNRLSENPTSDFTDFGKNASIQRKDINTNEILNTKEIKITKGGVELSFNSEDWKEVWKEWTEYKQTEHRDQFKSTKSEQVAINKLVEMSSNDINTAKAIINQSIANRWKGLFTIKQNNNANTATTAKSNYDIIKERHERLDAYFSKIDELEGRKSIL